MTIEQYKTIINVYKEFYPEDRLDIVVNRVPLNRALKGEELSPDDERMLENTSIDLVNITVYFPEITLTNDYGAKHTITDVYVRTYFKSLHICLARTSFTEKEIAVGYIHSHVNSGQFYSLSDFCTGSANTPINTVRRNIRNYMDNNDNSEDFRNSIEAFIIEVERMIMVESNDGGPYIQFSQVYKGFRGSTSSPIFIIPRYNLALRLMNHVSISSVKSIKDFFLYYASLRLDTFSYDGHNWQLDCTDAEFIKRVTKVAKVYKGIRNKKFLFEDAIFMDGLYYSPEVYSNRHRLANNAYTAWTFKDKQLKITKISDGTTSESKMQKVRILRTQLIGKLYNFLLDLINSVYANEYKDSIHARAYKVTHTLVEQL